MPHRKSARRQEKAHRVQALRLRAAADDTVAAPLSWEALAGLEAGLAGHIVLPWDQDYEKARQESNPAFQAFPLVICYCVGEADVLLCLSVARALGLWVAIRSGGHSTAGYSVNDGGMVIDLGGLSGVTLDEPNGVVHVLAGTDFDHFNGAMDHTGWHVPTGACGSVCVGGFVQGGGYGYTSRAFGMQSDCVVALRVALADGRVVTATANEHEDLLWAMRGGTGGNFGVLLQVTYRMVRLPQVWAYAIAWDHADAAQALTLMQQRFMREGAPDQLGYMMNLGFVGGQPVYMAQGMYCGSAAEGKTALAPLLALPTARLLVDQTGTYPQMDHFLEDHPYPLPDQLPDGACESKASGYIAAPVSQADWQAIVDHFQTSPNAWSLAYLEPYGGAIARVPPASSAFIHRAVDTNLVVDVFWRDDEERVRMQAWLDGFMTRLRPHMNGHVYQNYPQADLADYRHAYWGDAFDRLLEVKRRYDPDNFFRFAQSIAAR